MTSTLARCKGKDVVVVIDRPMGSRHPRHPNMVYPINYGYLPGTMAGDGKPIDAYVLGIDVPVTITRGIVVGIVERFDDDEDKLVVSAIGSVYTKEDILAAIAFQEQFFDSDVDVCQQCRWDTTESHDGS